LNVSWWAILVALVKLGDRGNDQAGAGLVAFAAVGSVLTIFASR